LRNIFLSLIAISLILGCSAKESSHQRDDEVEILKQRIEQHYDDGNYGLARLEIEKLLAITSSSSRKKLDEASERELMELLEKIREKSREEERAEEDEPEREIPTEDTEEQQE
jgi:hypothetical protein